MYKIYLLVAGVALFCGLCMVGACFSKSQPPAPFTIAWNYDTSGYLETCGCGTRMLGGLARRATMIKRLREKQPVLAIEGAHIVEDAGEFQLFKGETIVRVLNELDYSVMMLGAREAQQGSSGVLRLVELADFPCFSANLQVKGESWPQPYAIVPFSGVAVGITGVTQPERVSFELEEGVGFSNPLGALDDALRELAKKADLIVVCLEGETTWLAEMIDEYCDQADLFLTGDKTVAGAHFRFDSDPPALNNWKLGQYLGVITVDPLPDGFNIAGLNLPLEEEIADDPAVVEILDTKYRAQLKDKFFGQMKTDLEQLYLPPDSCEPCHQEAYDNYMGSRHSEALSTLFEASQLYNPDCMKCHVVYDPQQSELQAMNCIICHSNISDQHIWDAVDEAVVIPDTPVTTYTPTSCAPCHDELNSFLFEDHWPQYVKQLYHGGDMSAAEAAATAMGLDIDAPLPDSGDH